MFFSPRIRLKPLAQFCQRMATSTKAGIKDRKIWLNESTRGSKTQQKVVSEIRERIEAGQTIGEAVMASGDYFPLLFRQMIAVGDKGGQLTNTYERLAKHYDRTLQIRREFMRRLTWPVMQLIISLAIIGIMIWIMGMISSSNSPGGNDMDLLGWGLKGTKGLVIYLNILIVCAIGLLIFIEMMRRGYVWTRTLQRWALSIPMLGGAIKTLALARFTWAFQLVLQTAMDLRKGIPLSLTASGNDYYSKLGPEIVQRIEQGQSLHYAFAATGAFPDEFLDHLAVGEETGQLVEVMERQAESYQERAQSSISIIAQFAGYAIWILIAMFVIYMIITIFSSYLEVLNNAGKPI